MNEANRLTAVLPMRAQPPHWGHINLIVNCFHRFSKTRVILGNQPLTPSSDPLTYSQRSVLIRSMVSTPLANEIELRVGAHGLLRSERHERYLTPNSPNECVIVSGNQEVLSRWKEEKISAMNVRQLKVAKLVPHMPSELMLEFESNSRRIRREPEKYKHYTSCMAIKMLEESGHC